MKAETLRALQSETSHFSKARNSLLEPAQGLKGQVPNEGNNIGGLSRPRMCCAKNYSAACEVQTSFPESK